ncbi:MAG: hypothetical protein JSV51_05490 [Candidatus Bathyarchaeota archaeon]|nr:MAG: hypothetical protein JSV51_05490 [Candidatus Bathyarchaeota archaeon]
MQRLDQFLNLIEDGAWHSLKKISEHSKIPRKQLKMLSRLLSETKLLKYESQKDKVRITKEWQQILRNTSEGQKRRRATVGSFVLPAKRSVDIQGIHVTNLTENELELSMRVDEKLAELAIGMIE